MLRIVAVPSEVRTEYHPVTSLKCYRLDVFLVLWPEIEHFIKERHSEILICTGVQIVFMIESSNFC